MLRRVLRRGRFEQRVEHLVLRRTAAAAPRRCVGRRARTGSRSASPVDAAVTVVVQIETRARRHRDQRGRSSLDADGQQLLDHDALGDHRLELVVDDVHRVDVARDEIVDRSPRDALARRQSRGARTDADVFAPHRRAAPAEEVAALPADEHQRDCAARALDDERGPPRLTTFELKLPASPLSAVTTINRIRAPGLVVARRRAAGASTASTRPARLCSTRSMRFEERPRADDAIVRAAQARGRDHLHGLGDLLRRLDRADPAADVNQ